MHVSNVGKPLLHTLLSDAMRRFTPEKNLMNVNNVGKPSDGTVIFRDMNELMLERNPMSVNNVLKPLHFTVIFCHIKEFILEKTNAVGVNSAGKPLGFMGPCNYMKSIILDANPMK